MRRRRAEHAAAAAGSERAHYHLSGGLRVVHSGERAHEHPRRRHVQLRDLLRWRVLFALQSSLVLNMLALEISTFSVHARRRDARDGDVPRRPPRDVHADGRPARYGVVTLLALWSKRP